MRARPHLGGEVPVEEALAVQVVESPGDVQRQAQAHLPRQVHLAGQQLLQVTAVDVLKAKWVRTLNQNKQTKNPSPLMSPSAFQHRKASDGPKGAFASYLRESVELPLVNTHSDKPEKKRARHCCTGVGVARRSPRSSVSAA